MPVTIHPHRPERPTLLNPHVRTRTKELDRLTPALQADVLFVRALAELGLRDLAQARRLTDLARRYDNSTPLLALLEQGIAATERRIAEGTDNPPHN